MLELKNVCRRFDQKVVFKELSHTFPDKGIFALMGPSGCGKTTLLRMLAGLDRPDSGSITSTFKRTSVAFQEPRLLPWLTCEENLKLILSKNEQSTRSVREWLSAVELTDAAALPPKALSGGMQQRLSLARALAFGGDLLLLDEPFSALDEALKQRLAPLIREANPNGLTIVITHDRTEAEALGATILEPIGEPITALKAE